MSFSDSLASTIHWRAALALSISISISLLASGCSSHAAPQGAMPAPEVSVAKVLVQPVRQWDEFTGRVAAVETVELRPRVSGYVDRLAYTEGQLVAKGDLLFVIDQRPYRAALAHARADLARARSEAQLAKSQAKRAESLIAVNAISREEADTRIAAVAQADAAVRAAEAAVTSAELDLQFTEVRSPIAGRTGRALITVGNLARADTTLLTTVVSLDPMYVDFESDERSFLGYQALARSGDLDTANQVVQQILTLVPDQPLALTLRDWRRRFEAAWPQIAALGFDDRFRRLWRYYLAYCEAGFLDGSIDVGVYRLTRPEEAG